MRGVLRRRTRLLLGLAVALPLWAACAHEAPPKPAERPTVTDEEVPSGEVLRLKVRVGEERRARLKLRLEETRGRKKPSTIDFEAVVEERVESIAADGTFQIAARFADAVGTGVGLSTEGVDAYALALDEVRVHFQRTPRGQVLALLVSGVRAPLDDMTVRAIVDDVFGAQRGPTYPDRRVVVGDSWTEEAPLQAASGFTGTTSTTYSYLKQSGGVALVSYQGAIDGQSTSGATRRRAGHRSGELRLELATGHVVGGVASSALEAEQVTGSSHLTIRQRVQAQWTLEEVK